MSTPNPAARRRWLRIGGLAAVVLVPLAFAGLFVGAIGQGDESLEDIPVAIVNEDTLQTTTAADGTEQNVFAGRQLVTELTGSDGFDFVITNGDDAEAALEAGDVYAVITVPSDFSSSILSLTTDSPRKADLSIRTDDAHSYLTGSVAQAVGQTMTDTFGKAITAQYIGGIYASIGELGSALSSAADGATQLSGGAASLSSGVGQYTGGVDALSSGLLQLSSGAAGLSQLGDGITTYTSGVSQLSSTLSAIAPALQAETTDPVLAGTLQAVVDGLAQASAGGTTLASQASSGIAGIQSGISQSADGAGQLASGSEPLRAGADSLSSGAAQLADGLQTGAAQLPEADADAAAKTAEIAADPVTLTVSTNNPVADVGQAIATFFVPLGLWIGALAVFLVLRPVTRRALVSTARNGRLVASVLIRAGAVTAAQAVLLVALLHGALGVDWALLPATLGFSLLTAAAFTAFHYLLTVGLGRAGLVVSLFVLAVQVTSTGGVYPIELLSTPFQVVSPFLPLTYAVEGMQGIIAGGDVGSVVTSALILLGFGVGSTLLALIAIRRNRRADALGLLTQTGSVQSQPRFLKTT
jgi:putative membrane protein